MSHTSFVQQNLAFTDLREDLDMAPFPGALLSVGLMGDEGGYTMPRAILEALAEHLGGLVVSDLPPFFVACRDGLALVLTVAVASEFQGAAFLLPTTRLNVIDPQLDLLWSKAAKEQSSHELFEGTAFTAAGTASPIPSSIEESWRRMFE